VKLDQTLYLIDNDDSYEIVVDGESLSIKEIWRYRLNQNRKPEIVRYDWLDETVQNKIDDKLIRTYGHAPTNGNGI
jgi:hypothetical protein